MKASQAIEKLNEWMLADKLQLVIQELHQLLKGSELLKSLIIQAGRYQDIERHMRLGTLDIEQIHAHKNRIRLALLEIIGLLEEGATEDKAVETEISRVIQMSGSELIMEDLTADKGIEVKIKQKQSKAKLSNLTSEGGQISIDIDQD